MPRPKRSPDEAKTALEVGRRLVEIRAGVRYSQEEFSAKLGKGTRRAIADYEGGKVMLPTDLARRVCDEFDVSFNWLMTGRGPQRQGDVIGDAQSRRAEEEAYRGLRAVRDVITRHAQESRYGGPLRPDDLFSTALRLALSRFEREFTTKKGVVQFAAFLEDLIVTARDLLKKELQMIGEAKQDELNRIILEEVDVGKKQTTEHPEVEDRRASSAKIDSEELEGIGIVNRKRYVEVRNKSGGSATGPKVKSRRK